MRNEIWIIPTVGCVNNVAEAVEKRAQRFAGGTVEAIVSFSHPYGCSQMGEDQDNTRQILADLVNHPNAGGVLLLGLGCENSGVDELKKFIGDYDERRVKFLVAQECEYEIEEGVRLVEELASYAGSFQREAIPAGELVIGMKCGGSDGLSGITANPTVKISSNTELSIRKSNWIDFNCGVLAEDTDQDELAELLFQYVLEVASGRRVKTEEKGFHDMAIFKQGVTL